MADEQVKPDGLFFVFVVPPEPGHPKEFYRYSQFDVCYTKEAVGRVEALWARNGIETYTVSIALKGVEVSFESLDPIQESPLFFEAIERGMGGSLARLMIKAILAERQLRQWIKDGKPKPSPSE